ncbi:MAG: DUF1761 domain-containing protein [Stappiaceae bacterium]
MFSEILWIPVIAAAVAAFVFGALWYTLLGKPWMKAAGLNEEDVKGGPGAPVMVMTFVCQVVIAIILSGVMYHAGGLNVRVGMISALLVWVGFILTTQIVNHRFQNRPWSLTAIDCGHWLGVLLIQGIVMGLIGA